MEQQHKERLVLIGNGMAGMSVIEQMMKLNPNRYEITVIGKEPHPNYNRIQLSYVLEGSKTIDDIVLNDRAWYAEHHIALRTGVEAERIDTAAKMVQLSGGETIGYDKLIITTGSNPIVLPVPGSKLEGVMGFRDIHDCEVMIETAKAFKSAAVIGGGLLGLEAASGLKKLGMEVTVVHLADWLMERQLDAPAAAMLKAELEKQGLRFLLSKKTTEILGEERVTGLRFEDGSELQADLIIMAAGIAPNTMIAKNSGLAVRRGIIVDDFMQTSEPDVYAVGECNEHNGICYGLVAPLYEQGAVLAKQLCGQQAAPYQGSEVYTKLKISGVDVFSAGEHMEQPDDEVIRVQDNWKNKYKKLILRDRKVVGAVLFGDVQESSRVTKWVQAKELMTESLYDAFVGHSDPVTHDPLAFAAALPDDEIVCGCNGVTKAMIVHSITEKGLTTVDEVKACTGATRSCGGCRPMVENILQLTLGEKFDTASKTKESICGCTDKSRDEVVAAIRDMRLMHVREVMHVLGWHQPEGCTKCRPALNYYLGMVWPDHHEDEKESRFVNERLHANIQKDGTFSVIPRMYGGVTTPDQLRKIADVADKYQVKMVKVTGGQRIDLLGIQKEDLPQIWAELDMPSGYGYAKALRTVKTCVGSMFCRFGTKDSISMGVYLEKKLERLWMPAKFKMAVNGCPRNCAEAEVKDLGIIGNDGGWELHVGGNGGIKLRGADLLCKVKTDEELIDLTYAFIQYYRENGKYGERTSDWIERVGIEHVIHAVVDDIENRKALIVRLEQALNGLHDPWKHATENEQLRHDLYEEVQVK
jgi:nitrite reductase (NADH) large subunit